MIRETTATFTTVEQTHDVLAAMIGERPGAFWVAGSTEVGFMTWGAFRAGPGYAHTAEHTIIAPPGSGIAATLMQHGLTRAAEQRIHAMVGAISAENPRAVAFHARHGFEKVGHLPQVGRKAGRWLDLILMQKLLDAP